MREIVGTAKVECREETMDCEADRFLAEQKLICLWAKEERQRNNHAARNII